MWNGCQSVWSQAQERVLGNDDIIVGHMTRWCHSYCGHMTGCWWLYWSMWLVESSRMPWLLWLVSLCHVISSKLLKSEIALLFEYWWVSFYSTIPVYNWLFMWPRNLWKMAICGFYLHVCMALHGVWLSLLYTLCELYLYDFSFIRIIA